MYISYNKYQVYGKALFLFVACSVFGLVLCRHPSINFTPKPPLPAVIFMLILFVLILGLLILMILQLIFLPKGVAIDAEGERLSIHYFFAKPDCIRISDISEYNPVVIGTRSTSYQGILIYLNNGKKCLFSDFNLKDYKPIKACLEKSNVSVTSQKKFSFVLYFLSMLKNKILFNM